MIDEDDWDALALIIEEAWPGEFDDRTSAVWRMLLADFSVDEVSAGIRARLYRGGTFRPSVAELVAEIRRDPGKPTFDEACQLIFGRHGILRARTDVRKGRWEPGERQRLNDEAALRRAGELHPLVGAFVRTQGLDRLRRLQLSDDEYGEARRKQLADRWDEFVDASNHRDVAMLTAGRRGERLRRLDPLLSLSGAPSAVERLAS